jgi:hypothetical protein
VLLNFRFARRAAPNPSYAASSFCPSSIFDLAAGTLGLLGAGQFSLNAMTLAAPNAESMTFEAGAA